MNAFRYNDIQVGSEYRFTKVFTQGDVEAFSQLSGDLNPLHLDVEYSRGTKFKKPIVQGMLAAALFSRIIGVYCPGKYGLYMSQDVKFHKPIYVDTEVEVVGRVVKKMDALQIVTLQTLIKDKTSEEILVSGRAITKMLH